MKRIILSGAMLGAFLAFAGSAQAADKKTLVFVVNGASDFWKAAEAGVKKAQGELPNYKLDFKYPEQSSAAIQTRLMDDLVAAGVVGHHGQRGRSEDHGRRARPYRQAGGAVHHRQRRAQEQPRRLYRLEQRRRRQAGRRDRAEGACRMAASAWASSVCPALTTRASASRASRTRSRARRSSSSTFAPTTSTRPASKRNVEDTLTAHPEINCMVGYYSYNTPDIYQALKEAGKLGQITIVGFDEDPITLGGVKEGTIAVNRRPAALRMGLPGHEGHGQVSRRRQVLRSEGRPDHHPDQDHQQGQRRRLLG